MPAGEEFLKRLHEAFKLEAEEHVQTISTALLALADGPVEDFGDFVESIYRNVHTLKGAARAVNHLGLEALCQALETGLTSWRNISGTAKAQPGQSEVLRDVVLEMRNALAQSQEYTPDQGRLAAMEKLSTKPVAIIDSPVPPEAKDKKVIHKPASAEISSADTPAHAESNPSLPPENNSAPTVHLPETIRVHLSRLDVIALLADELMQLRQDLGKASESLEDCQNLWRGLQGNFDNEIHQEEAMLLTEHLREARASIGNSDDRMRRSAEEIGATAQDLLRLPALAILDQLAYIAKSLAESLGKSLDVRVIGGDMRIDKRVLEELKDALMHLVRNAVDHGIESPAERKAAGKTEIGELVLSMEEDGYGRLRLTIRDDGRGIDPEQMRNTVARQKRTPTAQMTDAEAVDAIFLPELSTREEVTSLSGRGMGMSIVRQKVQQLRGEILVSSQVGQGTTMTLSLPVNLATFRGVIVESRENFFIVPIVSVLQSIRVAAADIKLVNKQEATELDGVLTAVVRLSALLNLQSHRRITGIESVGLVVRHEQTKLVILVESFGNEELMLPRPLGFPLTHDAWWSGAALIGSRLLPILNIAHLFGSLDQISAASQTGATNLESRPIRRILVVEDSITSRILLKGILESAGYVVTTASDGLEGWEKMHELGFDAVVSDIEMPRLDGFALTERIRADKRYSSIPVILVTALSKSADRERGMKAGAAAYINKSNFEESGLVETLGKVLK